MRISSLFYISTAEGSGSAASTMPVVAADRGSLYR